MAELARALWPLSTRRETVRFGGALADTARPGDLLVLAGDLGAGKTFLARSLARTLGVSREVRVTSPTFTLVHLYEARIPLVHADLYRVGSADGIDELGLVELRGDGALLVVEWGEPYVEELGGDAVVLELALAERGRMARARATGPRSRQWLEELAARREPSRNGTEGE